MVGLDDRVVEEGHEAVAGEVFERPSVLDDERTHQPVVRPQESEDLFGLGRLREGGEVAKVAEHRGDLPPMPRQQRLAVVARHQRRHLGRQEAGELRPLPVDRGQQVRHPDVLQLVEYPLYHCSRLRSKEEVGIDREVLRFEGFKFTAGETQLAFEKYLAQHQYIF